MSNNGKSDSEVAVFRAKLVEALTKALPQGTSSEFIEAAANIGHIRYEYSGWETSRIASFATKLTKWDSASAGTAARKIAQDIGKAEFPADDDAARKKTIGLLRVVATITKDVLTQFNGPVLGA